MTSEMTSGMTSGGHSPIRGSLEKIPELGKDKLKINFVKAYSIEIFLKVSLVKAYSVKKSNF
jgi:hypothetical protein